MPRNVIVVECGWKYVILHISRNSINSRVRCLVAQFVSQESQLSCPPLAARRCLSRVFAAIHLSALEEKEVDWFRGSETSNPFGKDFLDLQNCSL